MFHLEIPPLRACGGDDAKLFARGLLEEMYQASGTRKRFAPGPLGLLKRHPWPGNIGEPGNNLHRVFIMAG